MKTDLLRLAFPFLAVLGSLYWTDYGTDKIQRADLDGSNVEALLTRSTDRPTGLALASSIASPPPNPSAVVLPRLGPGGASRFQATEPVLVVANPTGSPAHLLVARSRGGTIDCPAQGEAALTRYHGQSVSLAACEPGEATVEFRRASDEGVLKVYTLTAPAKSKMYWTNAGSRDRIQRADIDGSKIRDLVTGLDIPTAIVLEQGCRRWRDPVVDRLVADRIDGL